jgi:ribosomal protein S27E
MNPTIEALISGQLMGVRCPDCCERMEWEDRAEAYICPACGCVLRGGSKR